MAHKEAVRIRQRRCLRTVFLRNDAAGIFRIRIASAIRWGASSRGRAAWRLCRPAGTGVLC